MKTRIVCSTITAAALFFTVGCASVKTTSTTKPEKTAGIAASEQIDSNLPVVAAPPAGSWGGGTRPYSY